MEDDYSNDWSRRVARWFIATASAILLAAAGVLAAPAGPAQAATTYHYAGGIQHFSSGTLPYALYATVNSHNPTLDTTGPDYEGHTLVEIALQQNTMASGNAQIVELALRKGPSDTGMELTPYLWRNSTACGYSLIDLCGTTYDFNHCDTVGGVNSCGLSTDNWDVGQVVPSGTNMRLGLRYWNGDWWFFAHQIGATEEYLGWVDGDFYSSAGITFVTGNYIKAFGETAPGGGNLGCTDMATGALASAGPPITGGFITSVATLPVLTVDIDQTLAVTDSSKYNVYVPTPSANVRTFYYGGPGAC